MTSGVAIKSWEEIYKIGQLQVKYKRPSPHTDNFDLQFNTRKLNFMNNFTRESISSKELASNESGYSVDARNLPGESSFPQSERCLETPHADMQMQSDDQVGLSFADNFMYGINIGS